MYDDDSDTSDVNSDDIDKILENMDDLDDALLRGTLKPQASKKEPKTVSEPKKKVLFRGNYVSKHTILHTLSMTNFIFN